jgi:hypothetical protein
VRADEVRTVVGERTPELAEDVGRPSVGLEGADGGKGAGVA